MEHVRFPTSVKRLDRPVKIVEQFKSFSDGDGKYFLLGSYKALLKARGGGVLP